MKFTLITSLLALVVLKSYAQTTLFQQDFSAGGVSGNYVSSTPNTNQFNGISGATIVNGAIQFAKPVSVTNTAHFARSTNLTPASTALYIQMDVEIVNQSTIAAENALTFYVGDGFTSGVTNPSNPNVHSRFGINLLTTGSDFAVRHVDATSSRSRNSAVFTGKQTITFVVNNSDYTIRYLKPTGGTDTLAKDRYDLWVGTAHVFDGYLSLTPTQNLTNFKLRYDDRGNATVQFDNIIIRDVNGVLPIITSSFKAVAAGSTIELRWQATEDSQATFSIERSADAKKFNSTGSVKAAEDTDGQRTYTFTDYLPITGTNYYRLRKTNADGLETVSKIIAAEVLIDVPDFTILDNPDTGTSIALLARNIADASFQLTTLAGQPIPCQQRKMPDGQVVLLPQHPLPSGIYLLTASTETTKVTRRLQVR